MTLLPTASFNRAPSHWFQGSVCWVPCITDNSPDQPYWGLPPQEQHLNSTLSCQGLLEQCFQLLSTLGTAGPCPWALAHTWDSWFGGRAVLSLWVCLEISRLCVTHWPASLASAFPHHPEPTWWMEILVKAATSRVALLCVRCCGMGLAAMPSSPLHLVWAHTSIFRPHIFFCLVGSSTYNPTFIQNQDLRKVVRKLFSI